MRAAVVACGLGGLLACGGGAPPPPPVAPAPKPPVAKRVQIEDSEHEPEDGVQFINARGRMDPAVVSAGIDPHAGELTECYLSKVAQRRWLGGHVALHWDIRADGQITSVKLAESDLGEHEIERCLLDVAKAAKFGKPVGGDADFMLPLDFSAKGSSQAWDEDKSLRAVGGQLAKLDACDAKARGEAPPKDVVITVYVGPRGAAQAVGFASSASEIGVKWSECASKAALAWRLPDPKGQVAKLAVRYRAGNPGSK